MQRRRCNIVNSLRFVCSPEGFEGLHGDAGSRIPPRAVLPTNGHETVIHA